MFKDAAASGCPVPGACLAEALDARIDGRIDGGIWGGMTECQRRAVLRRRPNVTSWRRIIEATRDEHLATRHGVVHTA